MTKSIYVDIEVDLYGFWGLRDFRYKFFRKMLDGDITNIEQNGVSLAPELIKPSNIDGPVKVTRASGVIHYLWIYPADPNDEYEQVKRMAKGLPPT